MQSFVELVRFYDSTSRDEVKKEGLLECSGELRRSMKPMMHVKQVPTTRPQRAQKEETTISSRASALHQLTVRTAC
jgi:hypothetical protein